MHNHTIGIKSQEYDSRYTPKMSADIVMHRMSRACLQLDKP